MSTAHKFLLAGGAVLLLKGLYVSAVLVLGVLPLSISAVLGALAETGIGIGIVGEHGKELFNGSEA